MADETGEEKRLEVEAAPAPNRDRRSEPPIIEGENNRDDAGTGAPAAPNHDGRAASGPSRTATGRAGALAAASLGGVAGAIVAAAIVWSLSAGLDSGAAGRLAAVEKDARQLADTDAALDKRILSLETSLPRLIAASQAAASQQSEVGAARQDASKALALAKEASEAAARIQAPSAQAAPPANAPSDLGGIEGRLDKLEGALAGLDKSASNAPALEDRVAKLEAALAAPKSEARAAPESLAVKSGDWAALAIVAEAVLGRLKAGAPYALEQSALAALGAEPAKLAALAPFAEKGAPTDASLAADFAEIAPVALKAASPKAEGGVMDRLASNMSKLVRITPVGEIAGDDPAALASQISAALGRGQIGAAVALWARLPEAARQASQKWAAAAQGRLGAEGAATGLLSDAIAELAKRGKS